MKKPWLRFVSYALVGGLATLVEWGCFYLFGIAFHINTYLAVALSFAASTFANWLFGRLITFRNAAKKNLWKELSAIYAASIVGLLLNEGIMLFFLRLVFTEQTDFQKMLSKCVATAIVFFWNYLIRDKVIYRK